MSIFFTLFHIFPHCLPGPSLLSGFAERRDLFQEATPSSFSIRIQIGLFRWELDIKEDPTASFFRESRHKKHRNILSHAPSFRKEIRISKEKQKHLSTPTSLPWHHVKHQPTNGYQDWHGIPLAWSLLASNLGSDGIVLQKKTSKFRMISMISISKAILKA